VADVRRDPEDGGTKAGRSDLEVGTKVRVTRASGSDPDDARLVGVVGEVTHPFPGLMVGSSERYVVGLWLDEANARLAGLGPDRLGLCPVNLVRPDAFEPVA
jgi:hypothetical protein